MSSGAAARPGCPAVGGSFYRQTPCFPNTIRARNVARARHQWRRGWGSSSETLGDDEHLAAAIPRRLRLADVDLVEGLAHRALELGEARSLEHFDGEIPTPLQMRPRELKGQ